MMAHPRKLLIGGVALLALAGVLNATLRATYGQRSAYVHVRWASDVDPATQEQVERAHQLTRVEFREQRTWLYHLPDVSRENLRSLVLHPAVEDTHYINRAAFRIARTAERGAYPAGRPAWIADLLEFMVRTFLLAGVAAVAVATFRAWRDRRAGAAPPAPA
jgi:hypothetical protein